jgi:hypothetical protein
MEATNWDHFQEVLLACALAVTDNYGFFTATQVLEQLNYIVNETRKHAHIQRHLSEFISERRGNVLTRRGIPRQYRYRFSDPLMQPFIIIKGIEDGVLPEAIMKRPYSVRPSLPIAF